uniref:Uncharacterized protein n=1 Tax=Panagrolaimus sp. ES5 TaxID=591445 RepID=A0AC34FNR2_9BILA
MEGHTINNFYMDRRVLELKTKKAIEQKELLKYGNKYKELYNILTPEAFCPNLIRIGRFGDGGWEHTVVDQLFTVPICQILIEIHDVHQGLTTPVVMKPHQNVYNFLHAASLKGFYLLHFEVNYNTLGASEFTLLHKNCFKTYDVNIVFGQYLS